VCVGVRDLGERAANADNRAANTGNRFDQPNISAVNVRPIVSLAISVPLLIIMGGTLCYLPLDQAIPVAQTVRFATVNNGGSATSMKIRRSTFPTEKRRINETVLVRCKSSDYLLF
jgi:hypothetical protein